MVSPAGSSLPASRAASSTCCARGWWARSPTCSHGQRSPNSFSDEHRRRFLGEAVAVARDVPDSAEIPVVSRDPDDDYLIALAVEHRAERIVTGDADLLDVVDPPVPVIGLRAFLDLLANEAP